MKNKILVFVLAVSFLISVCFNIYFIKDKNQYNSQKAINGDISSLLMSLSISLDDLKEDDNLRFISSSAGSIFWISRSSKSIDYDTGELFREVNNFFINSDVEKVYKNKARLSEMFKILSAKPNDKITQEELKNLIETLMRH